MVLKKYRHESIKLIYEVIKLKNYVLTNLTCTKQVCDISKKLGFKTLETKNKVILRFPTFFNYRRNCKASILLVDQLEIEKNLTEASFKIYKDHCMYKCNQLVLKIGKQFCHIIFTRNSPAEISF